MTLDIFFRALFWVLVAALLFLAAVTFADLVRGDDNNSIEKQFPEPKGGMLRKDIWMPGFKRYMAEKYLGHAPVDPTMGGWDPSWDSCVCPCKDAAPDDTCCTELGPAVQDGERLPCKQEAAGAEPARSTKP